MENGQDSTDLIAKMMHLLIQVYHQAFEEADEDGNLLEGVLIPDDLYDELCTFVEDDLREFVGDILETGEEDAETVSEQTVPEADSE